jgi:hypothetical protein
MFPTISIPTFGGNDVTGFTSPIGGIQAVGDGGYIVATQLGGASWLLDVERWRILSSFGETALAAGGMMGSTLSRRTGYAHVWEADVVLDLRVPVVHILSRLIQFELLFRLPAPAGYATVQPRYYWLPRAHLDTAGQTLDAGGKLRPRQRIAGTASCHLFLLPEDGNPQDGGATYAGAYYQWLRSKKT